MNGTPRLRSAFPATPQSRSSPIRNHGSSHISGSPRLPDISSLAPSKAEPGDPLISFDIVDAPSQRLYAVGIFILLWVWRFYDWSNLMADESESLWLFMKWLVLDLGYLYFLESAHIPWLEFGIAIQSIFFCLHAILNALLMFRIPIRFLTWLGALSNYLWDSELAISGNSVKYSSIVNNPSLILGRQIIHVLPEGSAVLNPDNIPICLDFSTPKYLPLRINQTSPLAIELILSDLDTSENETITIPSVQAKRLRRDAMKKHHLTPLDPIILEIPIKKIGLYRLNRIIDETKMDVQLRQSSEALVVACPSATISLSSRDRCKGDLSNLWIEVEGTPPLRVKYRKIVNGKDHERSYQSIQPDNFVSPIVSQVGSGPHVARDDLSMSWASKHRVRVPLNETLEETGRWAYSVEEVKDALDNTITYTVDDLSDYSRSRKGVSGEALVIHDRPRVRLQGHDLQRPVLVPRKASTDLPVQILSSKDTPLADAQQVTLNYLFTPTADMPQNGEHGQSSLTLTVTMKGSGPRPRIADSGLYTLLSIATPHCQGEVLEPSSFMLINPPEPELSIVSEPISDQCEGKAVGTLVHLDLIGSPPFRIQYIIRHGQSQTGIHYVTVNNLRSQIEFKPEEAGEYVYIFTEVNDKVYKSVSLMGKNLQVSQEVKPAPFARFINPGRQTRLCIDQPTEFGVRFQGEGPWTLEYELVHGGKRTKHVEKSIANDSHNIVTTPLHNGGEYSIVLTSVTDRSKCKKALQENLQVHVRHQRPKISFGRVEGKLSIKSLEDKYVEIPMRLQGEGPWTIDYRHVRGEKVTEQTREVKRENDFLPTRLPGTYELLRVHDASCPGIVEEGSNSFEIGWIERPVFKVSENQVNHLDGDRYTRKDICEGEEDALDVFLSGRAPFDVTYVESVKYDTGREAVKTPKEQHVGLSVAQIKMDSSQAGLYEYTFSELGDYNYDHVAKKHTPLKIRQRVHGRPTGVFGSPGKVYSVCQSQTADQPESNVDVIPFTFLTGEPPFSLEVELTRPGRAMRSEVIAFTNIEHREYAMQLPSERLKPGNSVLTIRRIRDSRGCERLVDPSTSPRVQVSVHDLPNIQPVEARVDYCVGERIAYSISGVSPYTIFYEFAAKKRKATELSPTFRRLAESPGKFVITGLQDSTSACRRNTSLVRHVHPMPSVRISKGKESRVDIHAGGEANIHFDFGGTPPFEFTYIRTENVGKGKKKKKHGALLESKTLVSETDSLNLKASDEGTYEVIMIKDRHCSFTKPGFETFAAAGGRKLLKNG